MTMKRENYQFVSPFDGLKLDVIYKKADNSKALVVIAHGMAEHKERYEELTDFLALHAYDTLIYDHRGHGESILKSDDLGYFYDETAKGIVEDLSAILKSTKSADPAKPLYLLGHSMGSLLARVYLKHDSLPLSGLILSGAPGYNPLIDMALSLNRLMMKFKGPRYRSKLMQKLVFGNYQSGLKEESPNAWLSYNVANVAAYDENPKDGFIFTLNGFNNLFILLKECFDAEGYDVYNADMPILFMAGEDDPVIGSKEQLGKSRDFLANVGYHSIDFYTYPHMRHEIFNEYEHDLVFHDLLSWLNKQIT